LPATGSFHPDERDFLWLGGGPPLPATGGFHPDERDFLWLGGGPPLPATGSFHPDERDFLFVTPNSNCCGTRRNGGFHPDKRDFLFVTMKLSVFDLYIIVVSIPTSGIFCL
jgi:hypothetical protein